MIARKILPQLSFLAYLLIAQGVSAQADDRLDARGLIENAQNGLAFVVAAAQRDQSLNLEVSKSKPFWNGLQDLSTNLNSAKDGLEAQDDRFFTGLASANASFVQAQIALLMIGTSNDGISNAMNSVGSSLEALAQNFSRQAARLKQGGELTDAEAQQLDRLIAQTDELLKKLEEIERKVARDNAEMKAGIDKIKEEARKLKRSQRSLNGFVFGWWSAHFIYDWLWGWHWWWGPWGGWCPGYIDIGIIIWDDWGSDFVYDWALVDTYIDVVDFELFDADDDLLADSIEFLEGGDFGFDGDMEALTTDLDAGGWDDVDTDIGEEILEQYESNFGTHSFYEREAPVETFEDYGMDDFGGGFDSSMDFGGFDDW